MILCDTSQTLFSADGKWVKNYPISAFASDNQRPCTSTGMYPLSPILQTIQD